LIPSSHRARPAPRPSRALRATRTAGPIRGRQPAASWPTRAAGPPRWPQPRCTGRAPGRPGRLVPPTLIPDDRASRPTSQPAPRHL